MSRVFLLLILHTKATAFLKRRGVSPIALVPDWYSMIFFYLNVRRTNEAIQQTNKVLKMRLLTFFFTFAAAFIRGSLEPQR